MSPLFRKAFNKQLAVLFVTLLVACLHDSQVCLVEVDNATLYSSNGRESELTESFLGVVELLELDEGVVEVLEHWSK